MTASTAEDVGAWMRQFALAAMLLTCSTLQAQAERFFAIEVLDEQTGRGVPLVEFETLNHLRFISDSNGMVSIDEPDLLGRSVWFNIKSHGYETQKDGFGFRGRAFDVNPGKKASLRIKRNNLAERLYRTTGSGIYLDTLNVGGTLPHALDMIPGDVVGCDSVMAATYKGRIHWFWGDSTRLHYPLGGTYHISGATSELPANGGGDPAIGTSFKYYVGKDGGIRPMAEMPGEGPSWISAVTVLRDREGAERMYCSYVKVKPTMEAHHWGFALWDDQKQRFESVVNLDARPAVFLEPQTHTFLRTEDGIEYVYFANPLPLTRVPADPAAFVDPARYEGFTCLQQGTLPSDKRLERDAEGRLRYSWKTNTPALNWRDRQELMKAGLLKPEEGIGTIRDIATARPVQLHTGSVYWNEYRKRWILVAVEFEGQASALGEVWFAEADTPVGPWRYGRQILTHDRYSFYNPKHHPFFDQDGGKTIYFEGTYTHAFSGNPVLTPRYDYNQMMYRLDLSNPELNLPAAFYSGAGGDRPFERKSSAGPAIFFALERAGTGAVPIVWQDGRLQVGSGHADQSPLFFASATERPGTIPLSEFVNESTGARAYEVSPSSMNEPWRFNGTVCHVWKP